MFSLEILIKYKPINIEIKYDPLSPNISKLKQFNINRVDKVKINKYKRFKSNALLISKCI